MEWFRVEFHFGDADTLTCELADTNVEGLIVHIEKEFREDSFFRFDRGDEVVCVQAATLRYFTARPAAESDRTNDGHG
jgi:hypothetical protein